MVLVLVLLRFTGVLRVSRGVSFGHRINIHKLLLEDGEQEGQAVIQTHVQDELRKPGSFMFGSSFCPLIGSFS